MHNILYIVGDKITNEESEAIKNVLSFAKIPESIFKIIDVSSTDFTVEGKSMIFCFNGLFGKIGQAFIKSKGYSPKSLLSNLYNDNDRTLFYGLVGPISNYAMKHSVQSDKEALWLLCLEIKAKLSQYYPVLMGVKTDIEPIPALDKDPIEEEFDGSVPKQEILKQQSDIKAEVVESNAANIESVTDVDSNSVSIDVKTLLEEFANNIKLSDPSLGKSLKLVESIVLRGDTMNINIHPTNVIKTNNDGAHISFKDMCMIVQMALMTGSEKIEMHLVKGSNG